MKKFGLFLYSLLLFIASCSNSETEESNLEPQKVITISEEFSSLQFESDELSRTVTFTATESWEVLIQEKAKSSLDWVEVSPMSGDAGDAILTITLSENVTEEERSASVTILSGDYEQEIAITQAEFVEILTLDKLTQSLPCDSGTFSIDVTSNIDWAAYNTPDWITLNPTSGKGTQTITATYEANSNTQSRTATIKFAGGEKEQELTITQAEFVPTLTIDKSIQSATCDAGSFDITIISNTNWAITNTSSWITLSATAGNGDQTITATYTANKTYEERSGSFTISVEGITQTVTVAQAGEIFVATLSLSTTSESIAKESGSFTINVISNTDWTITNSSSWINVSPTQGSGNQTITVSYAANTSYDDRSDSFSISVEGITHTVTINQASEIFIPTLTVATTSDTTVSEVAGALTINITSNTSWSVINTADWVTLSQSQGTGDQTITATYSANATTQSRSATITFTTTDYDIYNYGVTQIITLTQLGDLNIEPTDPDIKDWEKGDLGDDVNVSTNVQQ